MTSVYEIDDLTKRYPGRPDPANDAITLTIGEGEIFGLLGPNGAGKTTLVRQLAGLTRPTSGTIRLYGTDIVAAPYAVPRHVAVQPQDPAALLDLTATEAVYHTGRLRGLTRAAARAEAADLLERLGLADSAATRVRVLSGGQKRLVSLAVTLVGDRPVLILDEPTNDLDPQARRLVWDLLRELNTAGRTVIVVTHNVLEAERIIDRVGLINHGRLIALGPAEELRRRVDQRVRVEVSYDDATEPGALAAVGSAGEQLWATAGRAAVLVDRDRVRDLLDALADRLGPHGLTDVRVQGPTLEDVYLQLGGEERLD